MVARFVGIFAYSCVLASFVVFNSEKSYADEGSSFAEASVFSGAITAHQPISRKVLERQARRLRAKPVLPAPKNVRFPGKWYMSLQKVADTCAGGMVPRSLKVGLNISNSLVGTDLGDGSPFFKGRTAGNAITFDRQRTNSFHIQQQTLELKVNGNSGAVKIRSKTSGPVVNCFTEFRGPASRR